ncbi:hypothetical protein L7F22_011527 [Adiantum nelumboides]|nr:hypothetical protein [Adiantum nelumboides]
MTINIIGILRSLSSGFETEPMILINAITKAQAKDIKKNKPLEDNGEIPISTKKESISMRTQGKSWKAKRDKIKAKQIQNQTALQTKLQETKEQLKQERENNTVVNDKKSRKASSRGLVLVDKVLEPLDALLQAYEATLKTLPSFIGEHEAKSKGLDNVELISINLVDKPSWYIENISSCGKVPALEHNNKVKFESLDLLVYLDDNFGGPKLFSLGPSKREVTSELLKYIEVINHHLFLTLKNRSLSKLQLDRSIAGPIFDRLETSLGRFHTEGPYFLGAISGVDFAYAPFIERYNIAIQEFFKYNICENRPRLSRWLYALNELDFYTITKPNPRVVLSDMEKNLVSLCKPFT